jgi:DNA-binding MarR family transcriptional regulator
MQQFSRRRSAAPVADVDPGLRRDAADLHAALADLLRIYQFRDRNSICCHGISVTQCYALEAVVHRGSVTMNELAALLWLDKSTASRVVDGLEKAGLVRRGPHPSDGRSILLTPTTSGRALHERIVHDLIEEEKRLLAEFDPDVRQAMTRLVARLARAAAERSKGRGKGCGPACAG